MPGHQKNLSELYMDSIDHEMEGGRFTEADIVAGKRTLKNGAIAGYVNVDGKRKWRIVAGANASYMSTIRSQKGPKPITKRQALLAFNKAYKNKGPRSKSYDRNHSAERGPVVADSRYLRSPYFYDYQGIDAGTKIRKARSADLKTNDKARMAKVRAARRPATSKRSPQLSMEGGAVDLKQAVNLLRNYYDNKYN